jgi:uncharacterized repeat protein (TIGR03806 family)
MMNADFFKYLVPKSIHHSTFSIQHYLLQKWCFGGLLLLVLLGCQAEVEEYSGPVNMGAAATLPYEHLSDYGFFAGRLADQQPNTGVLPYDLITPLFTDYAHKARFVWMPQGQSADVDVEGILQFPNGAALIKTFYYPADFRKPERDRDLVETRLLIKQQGEWQAHTYVWNDAQTDAELTVIGDYQDVAWVDLAGQKQQIEYVVPNKNQCKSCHNRNKELLPIGPKVRNLNTYYEYADGPANQLSKWVSLGYLELADSPEAQPAVADWSSPESGTVHERALAYLDVNCGHCHHPVGPAHTTGLYLQADQTNLGKLGFCKTPVAAGKGSGNRLYGIAPGEPDSSILVYRMEDTDPGVMMPELGRVIPHAEGIALIREWIEGMDEKCN